VSPREYAPHAASDTFGIYVHFPWCLSKCPYCDFASRSAPVVPHARYADAILRELDLRADLFPTRPATSIFFGGGTPSLWDPADVTRVLSAIRDRHPPRGDIEITLEANPGAADASRFEAYRKAGVNRLSIGAQSFQPTVLRQLGRAHGPDEVTRAVRAARQAGFDNVSIDLIYGAPGHDLDKARDDAKRAIELGTDHLSAYALTLVHLAEEVPMARDKALGRIVVPDDDAQFEMGDAVREELSGAGFERYEISNHARGGKRARHNLLYWRGGDYLGLGVGASGFTRTGSARDKGLRYANKRAPEFFFADVDAGTLPEKERETLDRRDLFHEQVFTGLRLVEGLDLAALALDTGIDVRPARAKELERWESEGFCTYDGSRLALTTRGLELHTELATRLSADA